MKTIGLFLALIVVGVFSCKVDNVLPDQAPRSALAGARVLAPGDPNLDPNWDWTQQSWTTYFNNANGTIGTINSLNPFLDGSQKVYGNVNAQNADMYPAKGWMLVARDFGTPTNADPYPFLILYNKYRGTLRVCILRTYDVLSSYQQITLTYASNSSYPDLFRFSAKSLALGTTQNTGYTQTSITFAGVQQWMISDFDVRGYSGDVPDFSSFNISMSEIAQSAIHLSGGIELNGSAQPKAASQSTFGIVKDVLSFYTSTAEGASKVTKLPESALDEAITLGSNLLINTMIKLVTGFSGGSQGSTYNIKLKGTIDQDGSIQLNSPKASFSVYLKPTSGSNAYQALQSIPWGVFNIGNITPSQTNYYPNVTYVPDPNGGPDPVEQYNGTDVEYIYAPNFITNAGFIINPG